MAAAVEEKSAIDRGIGTDRGTDSGDGDEGDRAEERIT